MSNEFLSCLNTPSKPEEKAQECILQQNMQQVEKNLLETSSSSVKSAKLSSLEKPHTHSAAHAGRFTIQESINDPNMKHHHIYTVVPKPVGFKASF
jgi:hypothetical protein